MSQCTCMRHTRPGMTFDRFDDAGAAILKATELCSGCDQLPNACNCDILIPPILKLTQHEFVQMLAEMCDRCAQLERRVKMLEEKLTDTATPSLPNDPGPVMCPTCKTHPEHVEDGFILCSGCDLPIHKCTCPPNPVVRVPHIVPTERKEPDGSIVGEPQDFRKRPPHE